MPSLFGLFMFILALIIIGFLTAGFLCVFCIPIYIFFEVLRQFEERFEDKESR